MHEGSGLCPLISSENAVGAGRHALAAVLMPALSSEKLQTVRLPYCLCVSVLRLPVAAALITQAAFRPLTLLQASDRPFPLCVRQRCRRSGAMAGAACGAALEEAPAAGRTGNRHRHTAGHPGRLTHKAWRSIHPCPSQDRVAMSAEDKRSIKIKAGTVKRLRKELALYEQEVGWRRLAALAAGTGRAGA